MSNFILSAFADEICDSLDGQMDVLEKHDIRFIELRAADGRGVADFSAKEAEAILKRMRARGFAVSAVASPVGKTRVEDHFEPDFARFRHIVELAKVFETKNIRMFSFYIPEGDDPAKWRDEVLRRMRAMAEHAERQDALLLHENEKQIYGDKPERCRDLLDSVDSPALRAIYDPSNFVQCGVQNYPYAFNLLRDKVVYLHMKDSVYTSKRAGADRGYGITAVGDEHRPVGQGDGCVREILTDLWNSEYEGFLSIEPHLAHYDGVPGDGAQKFAAAAGALKKLIGQIQG